jgi:hypothetical protein
VIAVILLKLIAGTRFSVAQPPTLPHPPPRTAHGSPLAAAHSVAQALQDKWKIVQTKLGPVRD